MAVGWGVAYRQCPVAYRQCPVVAWRQWQPVACAWRLRDSARQWLFMLLRSCTETKVSDEGWFLKKTFRDQEIKVTRYTLEALKRLETLKALEALKQGTHWRL